MVSGSSAEPYDDDDSSFLAGNNHPLFVGQKHNGVGQYKRVFAEHAIQRKVRQGFAEGEIMMFARPVYVLGFAENGV